MMEQSISKTRDYFKGIHGMGRHITTMVIRNILRRVLRGSIRYIESIINEGITDSRHFRKMSD
jgi:hypothetical protein